jgi:hypothetical protein
MPSTYALIVTVENYNQSASFKKVLFATKDGEDLQNTLFQTTPFHESAFVTVLKDKDATNKAILAELNSICKSAAKDDRIIFFFSGHGTYIDDENYIIPADAYTVNLKSHCISISTILGYLKKSDCKRNILLLDCCHSGFEPGETIRGVDNSFLADELKYTYRNEEYCCGFASSKSHEKSVSNEKLQNGVWTSFLLKALRGDGGKIYDGGILFSDKLQGYLNKNVSEFVKLNTIDKKNQTPIMFGNLTDRFIIADLNNVFEEIKKSAMVSDISFTKVTIFSDEEGEVKSLPEFQKGYHKVPTSMYSGADSFIKNVGAKLVASEIEDIADLVRKKLKYKRTEIEVHSENGSGAIVTPDFTYSMEIMQSDEDAGEYRLLRKLEGFSNSSIILETEFNSIFSNHFDNLEFSLPKKVKIEELIDTIEAIDDDEPTIKVHYNPAELSSCTISLIDLDYEIKVTSHSFSITSNVQTSPVNLITAYKQTYKALLSRPELKLIEN